MVPEGFRLHSISAYRRIASKKWRKCEKSVKGAKGKKGGKSEKDGSMTEGRRISDLRFEI
jgi:hypothetical protein